MLAKHIPRLTLEVLGLRGKIKDFENCQGFSKPRVARVLGPGDVSGQVRLGLSLQEPAVCWLFSVHAV